MENKAHAVAAGLFVLIVSALVAGLGMWLTRDTGNYHSYELSSREGVSGLQEQAAVRYKGVAVGKVTKIGFDSQISGNVLIRIAVHESTPLTASTFATLGYQGVTGLAYVLFFRLIARVGAARTMAVPFLVPAFGVLWGVLFLGEIFTLKMALGSALIVIGTAGAIRYADGGRRSPAWSCRASRDFRHRRSRAFHPTG